MVPVLVTLLAGLSTVLGALLVSHVRNNGFETFSLAFATGVMLMIALGELIPESMEVLGIPSALMFLALGAILSLVLDVVIPHHHEHEEDDHHEEPSHYLQDCECAHESSVSKGMVIALVLHNIIEGIATGVAVVSDVRLGVSMAIGIAIHNIPIGSTLAISSRSAGQSRARAVLDAALVGLSQPLGALMGLLFFTGSGMETVLSASMAVVAGILVFISFDELWPAARLNGSRKLTIIALLVGISFIPLTEMLF